MRRPRPCFSISTATGTWYSPKGSPPRLRRRSMRAPTTGSAGEAKGSLSTITQESCSPTTSTPCQKEAVASSTAPGVLRNVSSSAALGASPWIKTGYGSSPAMRSATAFMCA